MVGGPNSKAKMCDFSAIAPNVVLSAGSDDYRSGIAGPFVPMSLKGNALIGFIEIGRHSIVGANSTVLPNVTFHDGASVGAQSLVTSSLASWSLNVGVPTRCIGNRNVEEILKYEKSFKEMV